MEIDNDWLPTHFGHHKVKEKHNFIKRRSAASNLLDLTNFVAKCLNSDKKPILSPPPNGNKQLEVTLFIVRK